uniref:Uncharacterized protein n=1 Tax=Romanomermis culicivorax TaxID=13658 RepID=A0A915IY14_ROMCU
MLTLRQEVVVDEDLENITYKDEEEEEEKTLNNVWDEEEGAILDYDDDDNDENDQFKSIHNAHQYLKHKDFLKDKHCIIQINNTDDLCFAPALVVARAYIHKKDQNAVYKWETIQKSDKSHLLQTKIAKELMTQAGLASHEGSCSFYQWEKLQTVLLPNYQIKISSSEQFKDLIFRGHLCFMQPVGSEEIEEEEDVFETNEEGVNDANTCLVDDETGITNKCPINQKIEQLFMNFTVVIGMVAPTFFGGQTNAVKLYTMKMEHMEKRSIT